MRNFLVCRQGHCLAGASLAPGGPSQTSAPSDGATSLPEGLRARAAATTSARMAAAMVGVPGRGQSPREHEWRGIDHRTSVHGMGWD